MQHTDLFFFTLFCHLLDSCPQRFISTSLLTGVSSIDLEIPFSTSASGREVTQFSSVCSLLGRALLRRYTSYQAGCLSSCCLHIYGSIDVPSCRLLISAENMMKCLVQKAGLSYQVKQSLVHSFNISCVPAMISVWARYQGHTYKVWM